MPPRRREVRPPILPAWLVDALPKELWRPMALLDFLDVFDGTLHFCLATDGRGRAVREISWNGRVIGVGRKPFRYFDERDRDLFHLRLGYALPLAISATSALSLGLLAFGVGWLPRSRGRSSVDRASPAARAGADVGRIVGRPAR